MTDAPLATRSLARDPRAYLALYVVLLAGVAFWPSPVDQGAGPLIRLITRILPVLTYPRIEFAANIALFIPLGFLLTLILTRNRWLTLPIAFVATVTIECVQAVALGARTPSMLDVVANTAGACVGILLVVFIEVFRAARTAPNGLR
ncbi:MULTISPECIES: VanZ family protein [Microbacterium]|uniref:VanZ like family protein n=1 Tax=Microbacterium saccharophilum TaxID=1213358 RepID=A0A7Z7D197_9MICO|nr:MULTISPECIES: VanZ family protein [Microbacterium]SFI75802.1 VanZ like family protein [Microbacterium saccharophilum]